MTVMNADEPRRPATDAVTGGRRHNDGSLTTPLWPAAVWETATEADLAGLATGRRPDRFYGRHGNPTVSAFCEATAALEGTEDALAFASGMGALASVVLALCSSGDHIVATQHIYGGTSAFLNGPAARLGIETTYVDGRTPGNMAAAVRPGRTMLVIAETPANPRLDLVDLAEVGAISGPFTMVDSTFATPLGQRPADFGVDLVLHSVTKGIAGHNDVTMGLVAGEQELLDSIWSYSVLHGATPSPFDAMLALRGIRTLDVRMERQCATALTLAQRMADDPRISGVDYPGLDSHPQHRLAAEQMQRFGSMLSLEVTPHAEQFLDALRLVRRATSLGGPETLVCRPSTTSHVSLSVDDQAAIGIRPGHIRMSVGLEDVEDLWADISAALDSQE